MPFRDVIGHRRLVALLSRSIERGTLPPSLILAGPVGVGKRLVALAAAQARNCEHPARDSQHSASNNEHPAVSAQHRARDSQHSGRDSEHPALFAEHPASDVQHVASGEHDAVPFDSCGVCRACTRIARGVHPDVLVVEPGDTGSIKIEQVRDIIDRAGYRPFEGRRRVVIIDDADALMAGAQNALLKTLEEPPPASVFMLVTSRADSLLPTVRSRCPRLRFQPLGPNEVAAALVRQGRSMAEARAIAATADGSIGQALDASGVDLVDARNAALRVLVHAAATDDPRRRIDSAKELLVKTGAGGAGDREQLAVNLRAMASLVRDAELLSTRADSRALANPDVKVAPSAYGGERGIRAFTAIDQALGALAGNAGVKAVADWIVLQL